MKKFSIILCLLFVLCLTSCKKDVNENFKVESAYYFNSNANYTEFNEGAVINLKDIYQSTIRLNVEFRYTHEAKKESDLPKVLTCEESVSFTLYIDGKKQFSTLTDSDPEQSVTFSKVNDQENQYRIISNETTKIPVLGSGKYRVVLYANYFIDGERISEEIEFNFEIK